MKKLHLFGDSYSAPYEEGHIPYKKYKEFRNGIFPKTWGELLSEKLECELVNHAKGSIGNDEIFNRFCKMSNKIEKDDIVIINWTYMHRFRWVNCDSKEWNNFSIHFDENMSRYISKTTSEEIGLNRTSDPYYEQLHDFENIIITLSKYVGFSVFFWNADFNFKYNSLMNKTTHKFYLCLDLIKGEGETIFNEVLRRGGLRINEETNGLIYDIHLAESGHKIQFELFYEHIRKHMLHLI